MNRSDLYELVRTLGPLENQDDGALYEAGAATR
jgi:hypothetical protein